MVDIAAGRRLRPDGGQCLLRPAAGWTDQCGARALCRSDRSDRDLDPDWLRSWPAADRAIGRSGREPSVDADPAGHCRAGVDRCWVAQSSAAVLALGFVHWCGHSSGAGAGALRRASGTGGGARARGGQRDERLDAGHHVGTAGVEFHYPALVMAYGVLYLGRGHAASRRGVGLDAAAAQTSWTAAIWRVAGVHGPVGPHHACVA
ncbi:hypothetical protein FQZ97_828810 [compost metagenome]